MVPSLLHCCLSSVLNQFRSEVVYSQKFICLKTTHYLLNHCLKTRLTIVVFLWSGIVLKAT
ncbi:hypothetical protein DPMN_036353 [Dreissena polymorpha]|uniref:Uncharacterized protein n=1 Tax=Dreissena polymorpha TaxID=45954 RepID=A0A9D4M901_DREPO|nr:hypothetical protein DPMN_036353 [Dreissena polymorpha]